MLLTPGTTYQTFAVNRSVNSAEPDQFSYFELIYYKEWPSLSLTKGENYKVRQLYYKVGQALLQSRAVLCYYKVEQEIF